MIFTPTATSGAVSGAGLWSLAWSAVLKMDTIAGRLGLGKMVSRRATLGWVRKNKSLTLIGTEVVNIALHFKALSSPNLMSFVLGGTIANVGWIFGIIPLFERFFGREKMVR